MTPGGFPADVQLRPVTKADDPFLLELYGSTRVDELLMLTLAGGDRDAFVAQQFAAQSLAFNGLPERDYRIVELAGMPIGRLYLSISDGAVWVVDIALLPAHRGQGIGRALMQRVVADADAAGLDVALHVVRANPAVRLYTRLGFDEVGGGELRALMRRRTRATR